MKKFAIVLAAALALAATVATAEESAVQASLSGDILSAYISRGQVLNKEPVFQPNFWVGLPFGFEFNIWANMDLTDSDSSCDPQSGWKWTEFDLEPIYNVPVPGFDLQVGAVYFTYPQADADNDYDVYVKAAKEFEINDRLTVKPSLRFQHRLSNTDDWYLQAIVSPSYALGSCAGCPVTLGADFELGYAGSYYVNHSYCSKDKAAFSHAQVTGKLGVGLTDKFTVGIKGGYSTVIDSDMRDDMRAADEEGNKPYPAIDYGFGGVYFNYDF